MPPALTRAGGVLVLVLVATSTACPAPGSGPEDAGVASGEGEGEGVGGGEGEGEGAAPAIGAACAVDDECGAGAVCRRAVDYLLATCTPACAVDADCPNGGCDAGGCYFLCNTDAECPGGGVCETSVGGVCTWASACITDASCRSDEQCALDLVTFSEYAWRCLDAAIIGDREVGDSCDPGLDENYPHNLPCAAGACPGGLACDSFDDRCAIPLADACSTVCWPQGVCGGPCNNDMTCGDGLVCEGDSATGLRLCRPLRGSGRACDLDADCSNGERCSLHTDAQGHVGRCRLPDPGAVSFGAPCGDAFDTADVVEPVVPCDTDVCFDGACSNRCADDAGCAVGACLAFPVAGQTEKACLPYPLCTRELDCAAGSSCAFFLDSDSRAGTACSPAYGLLDTGDTCSPSLHAVLDEPTDCVDDTECADVSGAVCYPGKQTCAPPPASLCRSSQCTRAGRCSGVCAADTDCPSGMRCDGVENTLADGRSVSFGRCAVAAGSLAACAVDTDCLVAGELCRASAELDGTVDGHCVVPPVGAIATIGATCDVDADPRSSAGPPCANNACSSNRVCAQLCTSDADCAAFQHCSPQPILQERGDEVFASICL